MTRSVDLRLYLVLDPTINRQRSVDEVLERALQGGVTLVQVREKNCSQEEFLHLAERAAVITSKYRVPLIVNDRVEIAQKIGAQGIHLGQSDLPFQEARQILGDNAIIGVSVENLQQAQALESKKQHVDYLGVSSVFPTQTKTNLKRIWGLEGLSELRALSSLPLVGIGGIQSSNAEQVLSAGADGLAVVAEICKSARPDQCAKKLRQIVERFQRRGEES